MKQFFNGIFGSFYGKDGYLSLSKVMAFLGYMTFLVISILMIWIYPEKFDYLVFAILSAGSSSSLRAIDKYANIKNMAKCTGENNGNATI